MTMPANAIPTSVRKPKSLRSALTGLLPPRLRPRPAVAVAGRTGGAEAALQVVEDEADRRLRPRDGCDGQVALDDDEGAALERCRLQLRQRGVAGFVRDAERLGDQLARRVREALPRGGVLEGGADLGAGRVEDARGLDLARDLGQLTERLCRVHRQLTLAWPGGARSTADLLEVPVGPRPAPGGDDRLLRAPFVRAADVHRVRAARPVRPGARVGLAGQEALVDLPRPVAVDDREDREQPGGALDRARHPRHPLPDLDVAVAVQRARVGVQ